MTRAAIAIDGSVVAQHFGRVREFLLVTYEDGLETAREIFSAPEGEHAPGVFPNRVKEMGAQIVVAGGMGVKAKEFFTQLGVKVLTVPPMEVEEAVKGLIAGSLQSAETDCGRDSDHDCGK
ncbi:MAG: NifB/NifX family molybdenum-iron cluster-binding protein [Aminivibrio sp.]|jgi:predicted Fe-Mo cluster-binding NifX family protein